METIASGITEYELLNHGIEHGDDFKGCGTAYTEYEHVVTGCGDNPAEAIEDALEQMAQVTDGVDFEAFEQGLLADNDLDAWPTSPSVPDVDADGGYCEIFYYVSIRYNVA